MNTRFTLLYKLVEEQADRLNAWHYENPDADQSPDYQADLSRLSRFIAAIQAAEGAAHDQA